MVTPSNHRVHHARNPCYIDKNYGGVFILWDRMFGTFSDERLDEPCVYGITQGLKSWNPLWANFHVWYETLQLSWRTQSFRDKVRVWFKGPGWYPEDQQTQKLEWQYPKFDPETTNYVKYMAFIQLWVMIIFSLMLTGKESGLPRELELFCFFWVCFSFYTQGLWLEASQWAEKLDWLRLAILVCAVAAMEMFWPAVSDHYLSAAILYGVVSALMLIVRPWVEPTALATIE